MTAVVLEMALMMAGSSQAPSVAAVVSLEVSVLVIVQVVEIADMEHLPKR